MAIMDLAPSRSAGALQPLEEIGKAATVCRQNPWHRRALKAAGTFFLLAGITVGILTLRFALVLLHDVML
ncbi:MAG: hypothetical protein JO095_19395 [Alphaproteobacteria bacterium]|nr:hypothetical protein [Alphaproteobacteria bacterium]